MLCTDCKEQPATVHLTQMINGQKTELHLCLRCANRRGIQLWVLPFPPPSLKPVQPLPLSEAENQSCPVCHYQWKEFINTGFLGCPSCYTSFSALLAKVISQNFGNVRHQGKIPLKGAGPLKIRREISSLKKKLEKAVAEENFEKAVELRDQIRSLEKEIQ